MVLPVVASSLSVPGVGPLLGPAGFTGVVVVGETGAVVVVLDDVVVGALVLVVDVEPGTVLVLAGTVVLVVVDVDVEVEVVLVTGTVDVVVVGFMMVVVVVTQSSSSFLGQE